MLINACQRLLVLGALLLLATQVHAAAIIMTQPRFGLGGSIGLSYDETHNLPDDGDSSSIKRGSTDLQLRGRGQSTGYIWKPWYSSLVLNGDLTLNFRQYTGDYDSTNTSFTGQGQSLFTLYPSSRFPFSADLKVGGSELQRSNSENDQLRSISLELIQRYRPLNSPDDYNGGLFVQRLDTDLSGSQDLYRMELGANNDWRSHSLQSEYYFERQENSDDIGIDNNNVPETEDTSRFYSRHRFSPDAEFSADSFVSLFDTDETYRNRKIEDQNWQLNSNLVWQPIRYRRLRVTGFGRASTRSQERTGDGGFDRDTLDVGSTLNYDITPALRADGGVVFGGERQEGDTSSTHAERAGLSYRPATVLWRTYQYDYYARGSVSNNKDVSETYQQANGGIGHSLSREFDFSYARDTKMQVWQQYLNDYTNDSSTDSRSSILHRMSLTFRQVEPGVSSFLRLTLEDDRGLKGGDTDLKYSQSFYAQINRTRTLTRYRNWYADLTLEVRDEEEHGGLERTDYFATGSAGYSDNRAFNIRGLRFTSTLRLNRSDTLSSNSNTRFEDDLDYEALWENLLLWRVGRLELEAETEVRRVSGGTNYSFGVSARRYFGDF